MSILRPLAYITVGIILTLGLLAGGGTFLAMKKFDLTLLEFVNKAASKAGLTRPDELLIKPSARYEEDYSSEARNAPYPRILLTRLRGWSGRNPSPFFTDRVAEQRDRGDVYKPNCQSASPNIASLLFCYLTDPSGQRLKSIEEALLSHYITVPKASGRYGDGWMLALIYDITRASPDISPAAVIAIEDKFRKLLQVHFALLDSDSASLWHGRASIAASAYLLASTLDLSSEENRQYYSRAHGHFRDISQAISVSETWPEGYNYWLQERGMPLALALSAYKNMTVDPVERERIIKLMRQIGRWHIYLTRPDNRIEGWGDEGSRVDLKEGTRRIIDILAQATQDPLLANYSHYLKNLHPRSSYYRSNLWQIPIYNDPYVSASSPLTVRSLEDVGYAEPPSRLFGRGYSNHLVVRSGWKADDTFITFRASDIFTHHQHYDAGHFTLFKGAPLAVNSSTYGQYFSPHRFNYALRSVAKNTLLIVDPEETVLPNRHFTENVIDGGQRLVLPTGSAVTSLENWYEGRESGPHFGTSDLIAYASIAGVATYIKTDITKAYNSIRYDENGSNGKVKRVVRSLIYLYQTDTLIISDEIDSTSPEQKKKWLLHTYNAFRDDQARVIKGSRSNGIIQSTSDNRKLMTRNGQSSLTMQILKPTNPIVTQLGGPDYRYYVEQDGDTRTYDGKNFVEGSSPSPWFEQPLWRTEVSDSQESTRASFLIALQPGLGESLPEKVEILTTSKGAETALTVGDTLLIIEPECSPGEISSDSQIGHVIMVGKKGCANKLNVNGSAVGFETTRKSMAYGRIRID